MAVPQHHMRQAYGMWVFSAWTLWLAWRHTGNRERAIPWTLHQPVWGQTSPRDMGNKAVFLLQVTLWYQLWSWGNQFLFGCLLLTFFTESHVFCFAFNGSRKEEGACVCGKCPWVPGAGHWRSSGLLWALEQPGPARCSPGTSLPSPASWSSRVARVAPALLSALGWALLLAWDIGSSKIQVWWCCQKNWAWFFAFPVTCSWDKTGSKAVTRAGFSSAFFVRNWQEITRKFKNPRLSFCEK